MRGDALLLLVDCFKASTPRFTPDEAALPPRELLLATGLRMQQQYTGRFGRAMVRLALDADQLSELYRSVAEPFYRELHSGVTALEASGGLGRLRPATRRPRTEQSDRSDG